MKLETQRLFIKPLSVQELSMYMLDDHSLEDSLKLNISPRIVTDRMKNSIQSKLLPAMIENPEHDVYYAFWTIIHKKEQLMLGDICFKGTPNEKGEVEIGYGTYACFQGNGFMTEAVAAIVHWVFQQEKVKAVVAYTDPENSASNRVLEKNNFVKHSHTADTMCWKLLKT